MSDHDSTYILLREINVVDNLQSLSSENWRYPPNYSQSTIDPFPVTRGRTLHHCQDEKVIMRYVKIRTHRVVVPKDGINNPTKIEEIVDRESTEICAICLAEYKHEETIGTLRCRHEYHVDWIK
ncbi:hypothetical protein RDI58_024688 [Solanum bulbocastanum]|uniref:RING-type E3 ubiquitin transferase n=1 Tax=Solanum bulbocastanum TaxID=147425 RepID=A0AAN8Y368_SOLBU